ncbi:polysaccharide export protein [Nodosilinea sp. P-1105]|nr:polysaccharide export protein [Nodosilinea sp. P-1105]
MIMIINSCKRSISIVSATVLSLNFALLVAPGRAQDLEAGYRAEVATNGSANVDDQSLLDGYASARNTQEIIENDLDRGSDFLPLESRRTEVPPTHPNHGLFSEYLLGPGDQIRVEILGYENFDWAASDRVVLSDGKLRLPLIGTITAAGLTLEALEAEVTRLLSRQLVDPEVNMSLVVLRPVVVNIAGDVYRPGPVQLGSLTQAQTNIAGGNSLTTTTTTPTLTAALAAAGGIRRTADIREVTIKRRLPNGQVAEYNVNLWDALQGQSDPGVLVMFDGDSVVVPKATADSGIDQGLLARSSMSPANVRVRVIGEGVVNPGEVEIQPDSSVSSALAAAGGPNADAALGEVRLVRLSEEGQVEEQQVDLSSLVDNYQIQDGDVVFVPKRGSLVGIDRFNRALAPILGPVGGILGILNIFGIFDND